MKILLIRLSSIGDVIISTAVVDWIARSMPLAEIHFVTNTQFACLIEGQPHLRQVWKYDRAAPESCIAELKAESFDYVIDLHQNRRSRAIVSALGSARTIGFDKINLKKWLYVQFRRPMLPAKHLLHRYAEALAPLNIRMGGGARFYFPENYVPGVPLPPAGGAVIAIGANHKTKQMPFSLLIQIIWLLQKEGMRVSLIGGKDEIELAQGLAAAATGVNNLCGKLSLLQSAELINSAGVIIAGDTGMTHLAAALDKPLVVVWGNTVPAFGMYPYYPAGAGNSAIWFEINQLYCRPCSKLGHSDCPLGHFDCMKHDAAAIAQAALKQMNVKSDFIPAAPAP